MGYITQIAATGKIISPNGKEIDYHELFIPYDSEIYCLETLKIMRSENPLKEFIECAKKYRYWGIVDDLTKWIEQKEENGFKIEIYRMRE